MDLTASLISSLKMENALHMLARAKIRARVKESQAQRENPRVPLT
jgi:hypothetical protein